MTTQNKNVPALRFPEFIGDWEEKSLRELTTLITKGTTPNSFSKFGINYVKIECLLNGSIDLNKCLFIDEKTHNKDLKRSMLKEGDLLFAIAGATIGKCVIVSKKILPANTNQALSIIRLKENENLKFVFLNLQSPNMKRYIKDCISVGAQPNLNLEQIGSFSFFQPNFDEQQKVAVFLTAVDEKIQQLAKKKALLEQYKKGVMQRIFNQEIRFKDDSGNDFADWELKELKDIAVRVTAKNKSNEINKVLTNSATKGIVNQQDYFDKDIANQSNLQGYYIVEKDDFVYNPRISTFAPVGPIKRNNLDKGLMSPLYSVFRFKKVNLDLIEQFFETKLWHDYLKSIANYGARHDRMNITVEAFFDMPILLPLEPEQKKIADFLSAIDDKVNLVNQQLEKTRGYKKGLLQQMFV